MHKRTFIIIEFRTLLQHLPSGAPNRTTNSVLQNVKSKTCPIKYTKERQEAARLNERWLECEQEWKLRMVRLSSDLETVRAERDTLRGEVNVQLDRISRPSSRPSSPIMDRYIKPSTPLADNSSARARQIVADLLSNQALNASKTPDYY